MELSRALRHRVKGRENSRARSHGMLSMLLQRARRSTRTALLVVTHDFGPHPEITQERLRDRHGDAAAQRPRTLQAPRHRYVSTHPSAHPRLVVARAMLHCSRVSIPRLISLGARCDQCRPVEPLAPGRYWDSVRAARSVALKRRTSLW